MPVDVEKRKKNYSNNLRNSQYFHLNEDNTEILFFSSSFTLKFTRFVEIKIIYEHKNCIKNPFIFFPRIYNRNLCIQYLYSNTNVKIEKNPWGKVNFIRFVTEYNHQQNKFFSNPIFILFQANSPGNIFAIFNDCFVYSRFKLLGEQIFLI